MSTYSVKGTGGGWLVPGFQIIEGRGRATCTDLLYDYRSIETHLPSILTFHICAVLRVAYILFGPRFSVKDRLFAFRALAPDFTMQEYSTGRTKAPRGLILFLKVARGRI